MNIEEKSLIELSLEIMSDKDKLNKSQPLIEAEIKHTTETLLIERSELTESEKEEVIACGIDMIPEADTLSSVLKNVATLRKLRNIKDSLRLRESDRLRTNRLKRY